MKTEPKTHELKCWLAYFQAIIDGKKAFEYRYNDRDYQVGDVLHLREWHQNENRYTGRELKVEVTYALYGPNFGCAKDHAVLSIRPLPAPQPGGGGEAEVKVGDRIKFLKTLEQGPTDETPAFIFCKAGELGTITAIKEASNLYGYEAKWDGWQSAGFLIKREEFELIPTPPIALPVRAEEADLVRQLSAAKQFITNLQQDVAHLQGQVRLLEQEKENQRVFVIAEFKKLADNAAALSRELEEAKAERDALKAQIKQWCLAGADAELGQEIGAGFPPGTRMEIPKELRKKLADNAEKDKQP